MKFKFIFLVCCISMSACLTKQDVTFTDDVGASNDLGGGVDDTYDTFDRGSDLGDLIPVGPKIIGTFPEPDATLVQRDSSIEVSFGEDILAQSVNELSFTVSGPEGEIPGSVTFNGSFNSAIFTAEKKFDRITTYTASLSDDIVGLSGNSLVPFSWSFKTADGDWGEAVMIESHVRNADNVALSVDAKGNAVAIWEQERTVDAAIDSFRGNISANRFQFSTQEWGEAKFIESGVFNAEDPQVALDSNGKGIAVWTQREGPSSRLDIWRNHFDGRTWGNPELVEHNKTGDASSPKIDIDGQGNAILVWSEFFEDPIASTIRPNIWMSRFNIDRDEWIEPERIQGQEAYEPQIGFDDAGNAIAVWLQRDEMGLHIWSKGFSQSAGWGNAELIAMDESGGCEAPQISVGATGDAAAIWLQRGHIWANYFDGRKWMGAKTLEAAEGDIAQPTLAVGPDGNVFAIWQQTVDGSQNIWKNHFDGKEWTGAQLLEAPKNGSSRDPDIAFDEAGNALVVWAKSDNVRTNIVAKRYDNSSKTWGDTIAIEKNNSSNAILPKVAFDPTGRATVVWIQADADPTRFGSNVWSNHFD